MMVGRTSSLRASGQFCVSEVQKHRDRVLSEGRQEVGIWSPFGVQVPRRWTLGPPFDVVLGLFVHGNLGCCSTSGAISLDPKGVVNKVFMNPE